MQSIKTHFFECFKDCKSLLSHRGALITGVHSLLSTSISWLKLIGRTGGKNLKPDQLKAKIFGSVASGVTCNNGFLSRSRSCIQDIFRTPGPAARLEQAW